ncbi:MAG TPA: hypothetical protein VFY03_04185, partial [Woeseiaceae bacterium]|nr:hypothetical protein [Woeseiaceae bacterium]
MNYSSNRGFPAGNPIANALVVIVGALAIVASIVLGFFAFLVLAALLAIFAAIIGVRVWWFNRRLRKRGGGSAAPGAAESAPHQRAGHATGGQTAAGSTLGGSTHGGSTHGGSTIEGEFHVVERKPD